MSSSAARRLPVESLDTGAQGTERLDPRISQTRRLVFAATLALLAEQPGPPTVEQIALRSGVSRSTIYRRWPNPTQLFVEAFAVVARTEGTPISGNVSADLRGYLRELADRLNDPARLTALLTVLERASRDDDFAALRRQLFEDRRSDAERILRAGIEAGSLRADLDIADAVDAVLAPFVYRRIVKHERITSAAVDRLVADLLQRFARKT